MSLTGACTDYPVALILRVVRSLAHADSSCRLVTGVEPVDCTKVPSSVKGVAVALLPVLVDRRAICDRRWLAKCGTTPRKGKMRIDCVGDQGQLQHRLLGRQRSNDPSSALQPPAPKSTQADRRRLDCGSNTPVSHPRSPMAQVMMFTQVTLEPSILRLLGPTTWICSGSSRTSSPRP